MIANAILEKPLCQSQFMLLNASLRFADQSNRPGSSPITMVR
jgi:hypothetical protein